MSPEGSASGESPSPRSSHELAPDDDADTLILPGGCQPASSRALAASEVSGWPERDSDGPSPSHLAQLLLPRIQPNQEKKWEKEGEVHMENLQNRWQTALRSYWRKNPGNDGEVWP